MWQTDEVVGSTAPASTTDIMLIVKQKKKKSLLYRCFGNDRHPILYWKANIMHPYAE